MFESLGDVLNVVQSQPTWKDFRQAESIREYWPEIVGSAVAAHTEPISIYRQVLRVAVSTPAWAQNLVFQRQLILRKLNPKLLQPLNDIRFLPGEWHNRPDRSTAPQSWDVGKTDSSPCRQLPKEPAKTPLEAFDRWALRVKQNQSAAAMAPCPSCQRPALPTELDCWYVCGFCRMQR